MATAAVKREEYTSVVKLLAANGGLIHEAAKCAQASIGISADTFRTRARKARELGMWWRDRDGFKADSALDDEVSVPTPALPMPDDDLPVAELIDHMCKRFAKRKDHKEAKKWRQFDVPVKGPYALMLFGDPHIDDNGCDWPLLRQHCDLAAKTQAMFAVNIGDTTNNWAGRLMHLWSEQDTSSATARKLVRWFLNDSKVPWFLWLTGNHDAWPGPVGKETLERFKPNRVALEGWGAKVTLRSPGGSEFRLHVAHDFPGHSQWNPLHGPQKAALMGDWAHMYVAGHKHNWSLFNNEHEHRNEVYWLARARGYKTIDSYGDNLGYGSQNHGHSIVAVIDPEARGTGHVSCFADPYEGAEYLAWKRKKAKL